MGGRVSPAEHVRQEAGRLFASIVRVEVAVVAAELGDAESGLPAGESIIHVCRERRCAPRSLVPLCSRKWQSRPRAELALLADYLFEGLAMVRKKERLCGWAVFTAPTRRAAA